MRLWLAPQIHMAAVENDVIVLDVATDRYQCLPGASEFINLESADSVMVKDAEVGEDLLGAGLVVPDRPASGRSVIITARRELLGSQASLVDVGRAALSLSVASLRFRRRNFAALAMPLQKSGASPAPRAKSGVAALVSAADQAFPWLPGEGECLQRAYQLRHFLADRDVRADWVFGVRTWPFSAHCWLQIDDEVIGDRLERVRLYTPIMVV